MTNKLQITDQLKRRLEIPFPPRRIVSLVPSQTELLHDLGLGDAVVGITKFCVHPESWFREKARVGGTKKLHLDKIAALKPDLIIGNKEENDRAQIEALMAQYPVWMSDIQNLNEALDMIRRIGEMVDQSAKAEVMIVQIEQDFATLKPLKPLRTAYFIWQEPYMVAAANTFIDDMLQRAGFVNVFAHLERYPELDEAAIQVAQPQVILLSSEPYPFKEQHMEALRKHCPDAFICLADGELFSWYGSRLLHAASYFRNLHQRISLGLSAKHSS